MQIEIEKMDRAGKVRTRDSYVIQETGYEALQGKMTWEGLRYGDGARPRYCTGRTDGAAPEFPWQGYGQASGEKGSPRPLFTRLGSLAKKASRARGLRVGRQGSWSSSS